MCFIWIIILLSIIFLFERLEAFNRSNNQITVINYNTTWCGYSKKLEPIWNEITMKYSNVPSINILNKKCDMEGKQECLENQIVAYPTIILKTNGKSYEYNGQRTVEDISNFIDSFGNLE